MSNPRINVSFEKSTVASLLQLAQQEKRSVASIVRELTIEALDRHEDFYLSALAAKLDDENTVTYSHEEAWK